VRRASGGVKGQNVISASKIGPIIAPASGRPEAQAIGTPICPFAPPARKKLGRAARQRLYRACGVI